MNREAKVGWFKIKLEDGRAIPEPRPIEDYSGKFNTRVPRSLHRDLAKAAEKMRVASTYS
jgi:antitoxin HicB